MICAVEVRGRAAGGCRLDVGVVVADAVAVLPPCDGRVSGVLGGVGVAGSMGVNCEGHAGESTLSDLVVVVGARPQL